MIFNVLTILYESIGEKKIKLSKYHEVEVRSLCRQLMTYGVYLRSTGILYLEYSLLTVKSSVPIKLHFVYSYERQSRTFEHKTHHDFD